MERFLRFWNGYIRIEITGEQAERFLNLCRARGIVLYKIICIGENTLSAVLSVRDFFRLNPIQRKTRVRIHIIEKHGLPFFFYRNRKRKAFFLGILMCMMLLGVLSLHIWNIHVEGNITNSTPQILEFLKEQGVIHGISKSKVNCQEIAAMIRKQYPDITWVSARMEGTRLILTIQEGQSKENVREASSPCNLVANREGLIVKMITRSGIPLVKPGDTCEKGDILVLGCLELTNDSQEVYRYEYVHSDADIYVQRKVSYYYEFPLEYTEKFPTGEKKTMASIRLGKWFIKLSPFDFRELFGTKKGMAENCLWQTQAQEEPVRITENFTLPLYWGTSVSREYELKKIKYTKEQARKAAVEKLCLYEEKLMEKGMEIAENNVSIQVKETSCVSKGYFTVIEKIGKEAPVNRDGKAGKS